MSLPPVTVAILNYQRKDTLRLALERASVLEYPRLEILVVDNASTDGSDRMVREAFPEVRLLLLDENIGCAARNRGVAAAGGEIVVTIDNDVLLMAPDAVHRIVEVFYTHPSVGCVNFQIQDPDGNLSREWCHPRDWRRFANEEFFTDNVLEGASAFRRRVFESVGGYWPPLFIGHEGMDLGLRLLDEGHEILYSPTVRVRHLRSREARGSSRIYYTFTRNSMWIAMRHHRMRSMALALAGDLALMAFTAGRAGESKAFLRGVRDGVAGARRAWATRRRLRRATYRRLAEIRALSPSLLEKMKRHRDERLI
jgi:GT2 family glycosyltransferase